MEGLLGLDVAVRQGGLHVVRVVAAIWMLPLLDAGPGSRVIRLGLGLVMGVTAAVARWDAPFDDPGGEPIPLAVCVGQEIVFGLLLGWLGAVGIEAMKVAGALISIEMGMHMANQVDPNTNTQIPVLGFLFQNMALVLFFVAGGHRMLLMAFMRSFDLHPPGHMPEPQVLLTALLSFASLVIAAGLKIAAPVFLLLIVVSVCVGFLAKMAPNLHVLEASFPIRIVAALLLMIIFLPAMMGAFDAVLDQVGRGLTTLVEGGA